MGPAREMPAQPHSKMIELGREEEFRFEVDWDSVVKIKVLEGNAEIFGTELGVGAEYEFSGGTKLAVFSYHSAKLEVCEESNKLKFEYVSSETPMISYLNIHVILSRMRSAAATSTSFAGPRVLIVGPTDVGKTSLSKILTSYAVRTGERPLYIDLDPFEGTITAPTTIGAVVSERIDVESFTLSSTSSPLLYHFGHFHPNQNSKMYRSIVTKLASVCERMSQDSAEIKKFGYIIDTHPWIDDSSTADILHIVELFKVNIVLVIGQERLYSELNKKISDLNPSSSKGRCYYNNTSVDSETDQVGRCC
jgi:polyribonucleotide 5'-hydroxyl-kinase